MAEDIYRLSDISSSALEAEGKLWILIKRAYGLYNMEDLEEALTTLKISGISAEEYAKAVKQITHYMAMALVEGDQRYIDAATMYAEFLSMEASSGKDLSEIIEYVEEINKIYEKSKKIIDLYEEIEKYYQEYSKAVASGDFRAAVKISMKAYEEFLQKD